MKFAGPCISLFFIFISAGASADSDSKSIAVAENAIHHRDVFTLNKLLTSGAVKADDETDEGTPLLMLAMRQPYINDGADDIAPIVTELLDHGANPNVVEYFRGFPETPLIAAIRMGRPKTFEILIRHHANVNQEICYAASPSWIEKLIGEQKSLDYGTILDVAQDQLEVEKSIGGRGPADSSGMDLANTVSSMISQLKSAGAVTWNAATMHCDSSNAITPEAVSAEQLKPANERKNPIQFEVTLTHVGLEN